MKTCAVCERLYTPGSNNSKYCSRECSSRRLGTCKCEGCGKEFIRKKHTTGRFCSRACWYKQPGKKELEPRICQNCGNEFQPKDSTRKTCSWECGCAIRRRDLGPADCVHCGTPLKRNRLPGVRYCSRGCARTSKSAGKGTLPVGAIRPNGKYLKIKLAPGVWEWQHRHVLSQSLGRELFPHETVHHRNADPHDNRLENLELRVGRHGKHATHAHCATCTCFDH